MRRNEALNLAQDMGLDLVEVGPDQNPPVVRLMDYGKFKFDQSKRAKEARKASRATSQLKKVRLTAKIADNDIAQKTKRVLGFLQDGVKGASIQFDTAGENKRILRSLWTCCDASQKGSLSTLDWSRSRLWKDECSACCSHREPGQPAPKPSNGANTSDRRHRRRPRQRHNRYHSRFGTCNHLISGTLALKSSIQHRISAPVRNSHGRVLHN